MSFPEESMAWLDRCPKCFSRELRTEIPHVTCVLEDFRTTCEECGAEFSRKEATLRMPVEGGYVDIPTGAERKDTT